MNRANHRVPHPKTHGYPILNAACPILNAAFRRKNAFRVGFQTLTPPRRTNITPHVPSILRPVSIGWETILHESSESANPTNSAPPSSNENLPTVALVDLMRAASEQLPHAVAMLK
jgi:hypothetical protein